MRSQFAFYKSFDDVYQDLSDKQKLEFMQVILDVQFLRLKVEDVLFKDVILKHIWNAQKHSIDKSIKGYLESQKNSKIKEPFLGVYEPLLIPSEGVHKEEQEKEEEQGKGKGEEEEKEEREIQVIDEKLSLTHKTIDYLNKRLNKKFGYGSGNVKEINAQIKKLLKNGDDLKTIEEKFAHVINVKCQEWENDQSMKKHLNPETLFREKNFDKYLNQEMVITNENMIDAVMEARRRNAS